MLSGLLRSQNRPDRQCEASNKFDRAHPAFPFELNLQQQECSSPTSHHNSAISDVVNHSFVPGESVNRQRAMDLEFLSQISGGRYERKSAWPRIHRPNQAIQEPTILGPIDPAGFPIKLRRVSCFCFILRDSGGFMG
jgi:hypothetical protein